MIEREKKEMPELIHKWINFQRRKSDMGEKPPRLTILTMGNINKLKIFDIRILFRK